MYRSYEPNELPRKKILFEAAFSRAWAGMKAILFEPFRIEKWLILGFCAWICFMGEGGGGGNFNFKQAFGGGGSDGGERPNYRENGNNEAAFPESSTVPVAVLGQNPDLGYDGEFRMQSSRSGPKDLVRKFKSAFARDKKGLAVLLISIVVAGILLGVVILLVISWLKCRFEFIFLDNVVHDKTLIVSPWKRFRKQGNSLFLWRICFGISVFFVMLLLLALVVGIGVGIAWPAIKAREMLPSGIAGIITGAVLLLGLLLPAAIIAGFIAMVVRHFLVPIMYRHNILVLEAWRRWKPLFRPYWKSFALYMLIIWGLGLAAQLVIVLLMLLTCCFCCLGLIPLVGGYLLAVATLPISVFLRLFSVEFLAQFGDDFMVVSPPPPPSPPVESPDSDSDFPVEEAELVEAIPLED